MLSRNFRLQAVGDLTWLNQNYNFSRIAHAIDELVVLDVSREKRNLENFCAVLKSLTQGCFVPISAGGGISDIESARMLLRSGADKVILNSGIISDSRLADSIAREFGQQCVIANLDLKRSRLGEYQVWVNNGMMLHNSTARQLISHLLGESIGEVYLNSIDRDGTGQGFDYEILELLPPDIEKPVIVAGGAGNSSHLLSALLDPRVDAVATANLLNFVGDGLIRARNELFANGIDLPMWNISAIESCNSRNHEGIGFA